MMEEIIRVADMGKRYDGTQRFEVRPTRDNGSRGISVLTILKTSVTLNLSEKPSRDARHHF